MYSYLDVASDSYNIGNAVGSPLITVHQTGNIGIGTVNPDEKLSVNGTIHSREVKVDLNNWPDYVFSPSYKIPTLDQIKTFIDKYHHLPEMPSALQVSDQGLNLGEINKVLVKKVEELTLYLIQKDNFEKMQNKKLDLLQQQITDLAKELLEVKKGLN